MGEGLKRARKAARATRAKPSKKEQYPRPCRVGEVGFAGMVTFHCPVHGDVICVRVQARMNANEKRCGHDREAAKCDQCRLERSTDAELLLEVETHAANLRSNRIVPRGWWVELARRLRLRVDAST